MFPNTTPAGAFKAGRHSSAEPSPASTFGGSASSNAGDDVRTPDDEGVLLTHISKLSVEDGKSVERYSPPFIRKANADDPFADTPHSDRSSQHRTPTAPKFESRATTSTNWRSDSESGSSAGTISPSIARQFRSTHTGRGVSLQDSAPYNAPDIKSGDAQAFYPPSSCIFVANLLQSENDEVLEVAVTQAFRQFGTVYVKIRRDAKHMPFAFCQYTNDEDATAAIVQGKGILIKGRPCRTEKAKAHRNFYFERKFGPAVTPREVETLLLEFGRIMTCRRATEFEMAAYNLHEGIVVNFEMYDEGQAALHFYRNHNEYKMVALNTLSSPGQQRVSAGPSLSDRAYLVTYDVDKRSIFVGNLPCDITEGELQEIFQPIGVVAKITLRKSDSIIDVNEKNCFAFVEFESQPSVTRALSTMAGLTLRGKTLKIVQKDTEGARSRRRPVPLQASPVSRGQFNHNQSPVPRTMGMGMGVGVQHQSQVPSPAPNMSPPLYPTSNFATTGYNPYPQVFVDSQGHFVTQAQYVNTQYAPPPAPYNPYSYIGGPNYNPGATAVGNVQGSPTYSPGATFAGNVQGSPNYFLPYGGPQYQTAVAPSFPQYYSPPAAQPVWYPTYSSPPATTTGSSPINIPDDRSATPTPSGYGSVSESTMESA